MQISYFNFVRSTKHIVLSMDKILDVFFSSDIYQLSSQCSITGKTNLQWDDDYQTTSLKKQLLIVCKLIHNNKRLD